MFSLRYYILFALIWFACIVNSYNKLDLISKISALHMWGRDEEVGHETPGKETRKKKRRRWDTPGEKWRRWPRTENGGVPWSMAYAPSEQTGISK